MRDHSNDALLNHERAAVVERDRAELAAGPASVEDDALVGHMTELADRSASTRAGFGHAANLDERCMEGLCC